eukprot:5459254-Pyramimonas_sp.AAC.1
MLRCAGQAWGAALPDVPREDDLFTPYWCDWGTGAEGQVRGAQFTAAALAAAIYCRAGERRATANR